MLITIKCRHYSNAFESDFDFWKLTDDFGASNTDKTFFRPDVSSARAKLGSLIAQGNSKVGVYDFPDGKDTGQSLMTFLRNKSLDQTEIDSAYERLKNYVDNLQQEDVDKFISENEKKNVEEIRKNLTSFLNRDSAVDVVQAQNNPKSSQ